MCLLSVYPSNVQPILQELLNGIESNNDGVGFTIATASGQLITEHAIGISEKVWRTYTDPKTKEEVTYAASKVDDAPMVKLAQRFCELRKRHPEGPAMFHSRLATGGVEDTRGCHPYKAGGDISGTVVAHNGVMFASPQGDWRSDTRIFAEDILPKRFRKFARPVVRERLEAFLGNGNKIAIITVNQKFMTRTHGMRSNAKAELFIFNEEMGYRTPEGAWHSNSGFKSYQRTYTRNSYVNQGAYWWDDDAYSGAWTVDPNGRDKTGNGWPLRREEGEEKSSACSLCSAKYSVDRVSGICNICMSCNDCEEMATNCQCFVPEGTTQDARTPLAITAGAVNYHVSPDEERAMFKRDFWDEYEASTDPVVQSMKWEDYLYVRETETFGAAQLDSWEAEEAAMAAVKEADAAWLAGLADEFAELHPEDRPRTPVETTVDPDEADGEPGIIRKLS